MNSFDGMYSYEAVLMVLGVLLFAATLFAFLVLLWQGKPFARLLGFFVIPVVMIGYPGIQSFEFSQGVLKISKYADDLEKNPTDSAARNALSNDLAGLAPRPTSNPAALAIIARAEIALGRNAEAQANVSKALHLSPQNPEALKVKQRLELDEKLTDLTAKVEQEPSNTAAKEELQTTLASVANRPLASPVTITNVARAQAAIGNHAQAQSNLEKALRIDPNLAQAIKLKSKFGPP